MPYISEDRFPKKPKLIFMGTPDFAVPSLKSLIDKKYEVVSVITQPDRPKGRGRKLTASPVKLTALEYGIEVLQPDNVSNESFCSVIREKRADLLIVVAFGQILRKNLLTAAGWGAINIHASLLPKYRGAAPIQRAILNNESVTGLTLMHLDEGLDSGPIIFQKKLPVYREETAGQLHDRMALVAGDFLIESLDTMAGAQISTIPQDDSKASYAAKINRAMALVDWNMDAESISALIRGLDPWPGAYTKLKRKELKLFSSSVLKEKDPCEKPGKVFSDDNGRFLVQTGKGVIEVREMQYAGKKRLTSRDFTRGLSLSEEIVLGT
ncbi:MAG: methionyl-tRNA formyltransferase [Deltaproteobacteria bacterium]|nr:methionyl-tRNA formyltransferase [Deltaproteobacteria bacterium]MBW1914431.1 methionyl-tRNA formyltransferase [Deltaproteobacteria bacterium]